MERFTESTRDDPSFSEVYVDRDLRRWPPQCTCSEDRNGGDPDNHTASCAWANTISADE